MLINVSALPRFGVFLYVFCFYGRENEPLGPVKIGITANVAARLASVQTGQHRKLHAFAVFGTPNRDIARKMEGHFHCEFAAKRLEGEWFDYDPVVALEQMCAVWRYYFQNMPEAVEVMGIAHYEREIKVLRAWRQHYAQTSNVKAIA